ncbi:MAG TPA: RidA family protein [Planctomycetaceae bacterium]|nr:RidA family protein [Planctomycetaceae bacterium]
MNADDRIQQLKLELPPPPKPAGVYNPIVQAGNIVYVSGHGPLLPDGSMILGKVGADLTEEQGKLAARQVGLAILATLRAQLGSLDRVGRVLKTLGMVNAADDFERHPQVINGFSELMIDVFGESARAARSAVGVGSLPGNIAVEVECILELKG